MGRIIEYRIGQIPPGQKISGFLKSKGYSEQNLVNLKKDATSIWINGVCVHQNHVLAQGEVLRVCIREQESSEQIVATELPLDIVYEDEDLMVINKPAGMPIHPSRNNFDNSLGNALAWYFREKGQQFVFRCINRLDRDTSGLTIVAKHMVSGAILSRMVAEKANGGICREYLAIVEGHPAPPQGTISAPIARRESQCLTRVVDFAQGERAVTHYRVLEQYADTSLVACVLETGRTHQIRVHMQYLGHPLVGDFLYNPKYAHNQIDRVEQDVAGAIAEDMCWMLGCDASVSGAADEALCGVRYDIRRQALHAHKLEFVHPMTGEAMAFEVPVPEDMQRVLNIE